MLANGTVSKTNTNLTFLTEHMPHSQTTVGLLQIFNQKIMTRPVIFAN